MNIFATAVPSATVRIPVECAKERRWLATGAMSGFQMQNLEVVDIRTEENLMFVRGAVPGAKQGVVVMRRAVKG